MLTLSLQCWHHSSYLFWNAVGSTGTLMYGQQVTVGDYNQLTKWSVNHTCKVAASTAASAPYVTLIVTPTSAWLLLPLVLLSLAYSMQYKPALKSRYQLHYPAVTWQHQDCHNVPLYAVAWNHSAHHEHTTACATVLANITISIYAQIQ